MYQLNDQKQHHLLCDGLLIEKIKNGTGVANNYQITGGQHTKYVTSATEEIAQLDEGRNIAQRYIPGPAIDERVAQVDANGAVKYIHTDKQSSVIALSDSSGNVISLGSSNWSSKRRSGVSLCKRASRRWRVASRRSSATGLSR